MLANDEFIKLTSQLRGVSVPDSFGTRADSQNELRSERSQIYAFGSTCGHGAAQTRWVIEHRAAELGSKAVGRQARAWMPRQDPLVEGAPTLVRVRRDHETGIAVAEP